MYKVGTKADLQWHASPKIRHCEVRLFNGKKIWYDIEDNLPWCDVGSEKRTQNTIIRVYDDVIDSITEPISVDSSLIDSSFFDSSIN